MIDLDHLWFFSNLPVRFEPRRFSDCVLSASHAALYFIVASAASNPLLCTGPHPGFIRIRVVTVSGQALWVLCGNAVPKRCLLKLLSLALHYILQKVGTFLIFFLKSTSTSDYHCNIYDEGSKNYCHCGIDIQP